MLKGAANPLSSRLSFHTSTKHYAAIETQDGKAIPAASEILLNVDGQEENFSALLLRDMCHCPSCVHPTTRQKLYSTADIPTSIKPRSVHVSESSITLTWKNDVPGFDYEHSTVFQTDDLKTLSKTGALPGPFAQALPSQVLWDSASADIEDTSFDDYMANDAALLRVLKQLRTHGLVFVTDIPDDEHAMSQIATRMGPMKDTFYGRTWDGKSPIYMKYPAIAQASMLLTLPSAHRSVRDKRRLYLIGSRIPYGSALLPGSPPYPTSALYPIFIGWRS